MPSWAVTLITTLITLLLGGAFLSYLLEKTTKKAQGVVATKTITAKVDAEELGNDKARMALIEDRLELIDEASRLERESLVRTISNLRGDLTDALGKLLVVDQELAEMARRHRLAIAYIRTLLAHINDYPDHNAPPPIPDGLDLNA